MKKIKLVYLKLLLALAVAFLPFNYASSAQASSLSDMHSGEHSLSESLTTVAMGSVGLAAACCVVKGVKALYSYTVSPIKKEISESGVQEVKAIFEDREQQIEYPDSIQSLQDLVNKAAREGKKIAIMGAGKSQGGQTKFLSDSCYRVCLNKINKLVKLDVLNKRVTIQAGATWQQLIEYINPHRLAVKAMQSYSTFSIGGSLGVNVHGQDLIENPLIRTVESFKLLKADGSIIDVNRTNENKELFGLVIGGYGLLGIVIEVTLQLTDDELLERKAEYIDARIAREHFLLHVQTNLDCRFMSARLSVNAKDLFNKSLFIKYEKSQSANEELHELVPQNGISWRQFLIKKLARSNIRFPLESWFNQLPQTISRNNFMNSSIYDLPQDNENERYILQEYFIPSFPYEDGTNLYAFREYLKDITQEFGIEVLNLSARFIREDTESVLAFSHHEACALVFFIKVPKNVKAESNIIRWTRCLIDKALELHGTFYLPYQLIATQEQFERSYPRWREFVGRKRHYDPQELFMNQLYEKYGSHIPQESGLARSGAQAKRMQALPSDLRRTVIKKAALPAKIKPA